eukprot:s971_g21.t1
MLNHYLVITPYCEENVLRFERLNEDLTDLGARYGIHIPPLPRVNESEMPRFKVEDLDADTRRETSMPRNAGGCLGEDATDPALRGSVDQSGSAYGCRSRTLRTLRTSHTSCTSATNPFLVPERPVALECHLCEMAWRPLSRPQAVLHLSLPGLCKGQGECRLEAHSKGMCHAVALWAEFQVSRTSGPCLSTGPTSAPNGWCQAMQLLEEPMDLSAGSMLSVEMAVEDSEADIRIDCANGAVKRQRKTWLEFLSFVNSRGQLLGRNMAGYPKGAQAQDFIKGWPHPELLSRAELRAALTESFKKGLEMSEETLNYGDKANGAYMLGHPRFLEGLAKFLSSQYGAPCDPKTLMSTVGASMGTDLAMRAYAKPGDICVFEEPTYFLAFTMARNSYMDLKGVPIHEDGMDLDALDKVCTENAGKVKFVYTVCIHHNPTGYTMSNEKRVKLMQLAKKHKFFVVADEAYQLLNFEKLDIKPLFYHDDPEDPYGASDSKMHMGYQKTI